MVIGHMLSPGGRTSWSVSHLTNDIEDSIPTAQLSATLTIHSERNLYMWQAFLVRVLLRVLGQLLCNLEEFCRHRTFLHFLCHLNQLAVDVLDNCLTRFTRQYLSHRKAKRKKWELINALFTPHTQEAHAHTVNPPITARAVILKPVVRGVVITRGPLPLQKGHYHYKRPSIITRGPLLLQEHHYYYKRAIVITRGSLLLQEGNCYYRRVIIITRGPLLLQEHHYYYKRAITITKGPLSLQEG